MDGFQKVELAAWIGFGTLLITFIAVVLAVYAFIREIQFGRLREEVRNAKKEFHKASEKLEFSMEIEELCNRFLVENSDSRSSELQRFKVSLYRLAFSSDSEVVEDATRYICEAANPLKNNSENGSYSLHNGIKGFLQHLWFRKRFHSLSIAKETAEEYRLTFGEPILNISFLDLAAIGKAE